MQILHINVSWIKSKIDTVPLLSLAHKDELTSLTPSLIILVAIGAWPWPSDRAWNLQLLKHQDNEEKVSCMAQVLQTIMTYNLNLNLQWCRFICQWINWDLPYHFNKIFYFFEQPLCVDLPGAYQVQVAQWTLTPQVVYVPGVPDVPVSRILLQGIDDSMEVWEFI